MPIPLTCLFLRKPHFLINRCLLLRITHNLILCNISNSRHSQYVTNLANRDVKKSPSFIANSNSIVVRAVLSKGLTSVFHFIPKQKKNHTKNMLVFIQKHFSLCQITVYIFVNELSKIKMNKYDNN